MIAKYGGSLPLKLPHHMWSMKHEQRSSSIERIFHDAVMFIADYQVARQKTIFKAILLFYAWHTLCSCFQRSEDDPNAFFNVLCLFQDFPHFIITSRWKISTQQVKSSSIIADSVVKPFSREIVPIRSCIHRLNTRWIPFPPFPHQPIRPPPWLVIAEYSTWENGTNDDIVCLRNLLWKLRTRCNIFVLEEKSFGKKRARELFSTIKSFCRAFVWQWKLPDDINVAENNCRFAYSLCIWIENVMDAKKWKKKLIWWKKNQMTRIRNGNGKHFCVFDALKLKRSNT